MSIFRDIIEIKTAHIINNAISPVLDDFGVKIGTDQEFMAALYNAVRAAVLEITQC